MKRLAALALIFMFLKTSYGQKSGELYDSILKLDSSYFHSFNACDLENYASFLTFDYEFYHDKQGLTTSKKNEMRSMEIFCGEQRSRQQISRELVLESFEVYPLHDYGAIENGEHIFHLVIDEHTSKPISKAKFMNIWRNDEGKWKLARTVSYDHQPYGKIQLADEILEQYEGRYKASDRIVEIKKEGSMLKMIDIVDSKEVWSAEMLAEAEDIFYLNQNDIQLKFIKEKASVHKLLVYENGKQIEEIIKEH